MAKGYSTLALLVDRSAHVRASIFRSCVSDLDFSLGSIDKWVLSVKNKE